MTETEVEAIFNPVELALDALGKVDRYEGHPSGLAHAIQGIGYALLALALKDSAQTVPEAPEGDPDHRHVFFIGTDHCATCGAQYEETVEHQHRLTFDTAGTGWRQCTECGERFPVEKAEGEG